MKKIWIVSAMAAVCIFCCTAFLACGENNNGVAAPANLSVSTSEILSWDRVENAVGYVVSIDGNDYETETNSYDIIDLEYGRHELSVMALASNGFPSERSETLVYEIAQPQFKAQSIDGQTCSLISEDSESISGKVIVPQTYDGKTVTDVNFANCLKITSVVLPISINEISESSFTSCIALTRMKLPDSIVSINFSAFENCTSLISVYLPESLTKIESLAFRGCTSLSEIDFPGGLKKIGGEVFKDTAITRIHLPAALQEIPSTAFDLNNVVEITINENNPVYTSDGNCLIKRENNEVVMCCKTSVLPEYAAIIEYGAFYGIRDMDLYIPASVTKIGIQISSDFNAKLIKFVPKSITVAEDNPVYKSENNCLIEKATGLLVKGCADSVIPEYCTVIGECAFEGSDIEELIVPDGIVEIRRQAFKNCKSLRTVKIGADNKTIGTSAFYGCEGLECVDIGGTEVIGAYAFELCGKIDTVIFRSSLKRIRREAFNHTVVSVVMPESIETVEGGAFLKATVYMPYTSWEDERIGDRFIRGYDGSFSSVDTELVFGCTLAESDERGVYVVSQ